MGAPTLLDIALRLAIMQVANITDVADMPWHHAKQFLRKVEDPNQLHQIEIASPQIADADAELWKAFIRRDCPSLKGGIPEPKNPRSWWKVYRKLVNEEQALKDQAEASLRQSLNAIGEQKGHVHVSKKALYAPPTRGEHEDLFIGRDINPRFKRMMSRGDVPAGTKLYQAPGSKSGNSILAKIRKQVASKPKPSINTVKPKMTRPDLPKEETAAELSARQKVALASARKTWYTPPSTKVVRAPSTGYSTGYEKTSSILMSEREAKLKAAQQAKPKSPGSQANLVKIPVRTSPPPTKPPSTPPAVLVRQASGAIAAEASPPATIPRKRTPVSVFAPVPKKRKV